MKKLFFIIVLILLFVTVAFFAFNSYIYNLKQRDESEFMKPYRATLTGEYVCLPYAKGSGPQTLQCAFGIKTDVGEYYALNLGLMPEGSLKLKIGDRFSASGLITPLEGLDADKRRESSIEGTFSITDSVERL